MKTIENGIVRCKPEGILILWISKDKARKAYNRSVILCDLCNVEVDWPVFPVIDIPPDVDFLDPEYIPGGGKALCKSCAKKLYGLKDIDVCRVDRLWYVYDIFMPRY